MSSGEKIDRNLPMVEGYTVEALIDTGGFSRVYRATQHGLERSVAIKVLNSSFEDERQQRTFERECRVMGQLSTHPNIVTVFASALTTSGQPCIVMELYEGTYRGDDQLDIAEVVDVGAKVADALQAIHQDGIVHRDIKPHNIFVSSHGQPAIGDFGISSIESERTLTGGAGFSINYAPPEVFEEGGAGAPGDVYSLGATLYQLASGEVPFPHTGDPAEKTRATVHKIITAPPPSLRRPDAPPELDRLLRRCMAKDPAMRPSSPREVATELRRIQAKVGVPDTDRTLARLRSPRGVPGPVPSDPTVDRRGGANQGSASAPSRSTDRPSREATGNVTVVRDRAVSMEEPARESVTQRRRDPGRRRMLTVGVAAAVAVIVVSALVIAFLGGDSEADLEADTTSPSMPTSTAGPFVVLTAPTDLTVDRAGDGEYQIAWSSELESVDFQILLVGSSENRFTSETAYTWTVVDDPGSACFEVRTVNDARTRVSQATAGPVCSG